MRKTNQSGSSMIEMMGVLGIIAMVTVGIIATVSKIYDRYKEATVITQIRDLQKNIHARYATAITYEELQATDIAEKLIKERVIPYNMVTGNRIYHAYGGPVALSGNKNYFSVKFSNVKRSGCVELLSVNWSVNETSDLLQIKANNKLYTWPDDGNKDLPIGVVEATTACSSKDNNIIEWYFQ